MVKLYYHNGSKNHGCEAIVRATKKILKEESIELYSRNPAADIMYGLESIVNVYSDETLQIPKKSLKYIIAAVYRKIYRNNTLFTYFSHQKFFSNIRPGDVCVSIGGDNYCYSGREVLGDYNKIIHKKGAKTVLWGCSFESKDMTPEIAKDIACYDLITARETISYNELKKYNKNTFLVHDPAFQLDLTKIALPDNFIEGNMVGVNISPLIIACENECGITIKNFQQLMKYILDNTNMNIALISHVVIEHDDDRLVLQTLLERFGDTGRVVLVEDCNCMELKYVISQCRFFVGARTHATIAAYSTHVPTLVVGYSVKARGIAKDIFGTEENYVLPVQMLQDEDDLCEAFQRLMRDEIEIRNNLYERMPEYCKNVLKGNVMIRDLLNGKENGKNGVRK